MRTLAAVRRRLKELVAQQSAAVEQIDVVLCEDGATAMFYAHLSDGNALAVTLDLPAEAVATFDSALYAAFFGNLH